MHSLPKTMVSYMQNLIGTCVKGGLTVFYGSATAVAFTYKLLTRGPWYVFSVPEIERPSDLDNPEYGKHRIAKLPDINLHYVVSGDPSKPLMLMVHGFPELWYSFRHQIKQFNKDYRVVAMNMRGYADSDRPGDYTGYSTEKLVQDIHDMIEYHGYEKCVLVGHDWGGILCYMFATKHPEMIEKMVICNASHPAAWQKLTGTSFAQLRKSWYVFMFQWPLLPNIALRMGEQEWIKQMLVGEESGMKPGAITDEELKAYLYTFQTYDAVSGPINFYRAAIKLPAKDPDFKQRCKVPTLLIWGTRDVGLNRKLAELTLNYVPNCQLEYVEDGSHWIQQEKPVLVNRFMTEFLNKPQMLTHAKL